MAAQLLGADKVPCIRLTHLSDTQRKAYIIADNKLALNSGWDEAMLGLELSDLREADFESAAAAISPPGRIACVHSFSARTRVQEKPCRDRRASSRETRATKKALRQERLLA
jgi:hypothetical protein